MKAYQRSNERLLPNDSSDGNYSAPRSVRKFVEWGESKEIVTYYLVTK